MFAACLLLVLAVASGTLLTWIYDRTAPMLPRLCIGAASGLALFTTVGYLFALWLGLNGLAIALTAAVMFLLWLLLLRANVRRSVKQDLRLAIDSAGNALRLHRARVAAYVVFYVGLAILFGVLFARAAYATPEGIFTGDQHDLGDLTLHMDVIASFVQGQNLPPQDPTFAGVRFAYPFFVDFLVAMLVRSGAGILQAMWIQNVVLALALIGMLHYFTALLTRDRLAGLLAPLLVLFSGGLGWAWIFQDLHESSSGLIPLLGNLPHDYTIMDAGGILRWGNSLTTLFIPQRSILFGLPLALVIFSQWWIAIERREQDSVDEGTRRMLAAGLMAGLLPLIHAHSFLVVMGVGLCLALIFRFLWRSWLIFFIAALVVASPQLLWLAGNGGVNSSRYIGWQPGWDHDGFNVVLFWLANTGIFTPLLLGAIFWEKPGFPLPRRLIKFYAPFALCFIIPNLIKVAPWVWDNIKVLFYWYVASVPLVALLLARGLRQRSRWRWISGAALATLLLAGVLDVWKLADGQTEYLEFSARAITIAEDISRDVPPRAIVLHAPTFYSPVFLTGRPSLLGYPGWIWSRGINYSEREAGIKRIYAGEPDAAELLRRYHVDYVLVGPEELSSLSVNLPFLSKYMLLASEGPYRLYRTGSPDMRIKK